MGQLIFWGLFFWLIWFVVSRLVSIFRENKAKELLKEYLYWSEFITDINSIEEFKEKLQTIKDKKVLKDKYNHFYLTKEEVSAFNIEVQEITIKEVLESETYPLFLITRLERITLYEKEDLSEVDTKCEMVWLEAFGVKFHLILKKNKTIFYPKSFNKENPYRYGYTKIYNEKGQVGVYDIEQEKSALMIGYKSIESFGNIVEICFLDDSYGIFDLTTGKKLSTSNTKTYPYIKKELKEKIDLSKIELHDYIKLFKKLETKEDLEHIGLWGAKVGVYEVPTHFEDVIEDTSSGIIEWNHYCSADIYDMSIELPVSFTKKNGESLSIGIKPEYLVLDKEYRERLTKLENLFDGYENTKKTTKINEFTDLLKRGNLPDDDRIVPNYLKIKNSQFDDVDFSNNTVDDIVKLSSEEFNELVSVSNNGLLFTWLSTLSDIELQKFYKYCEDVVKLSNEAEESAKEQFENAMASIKTEEITDEQRARATLEMPLMINYAKNLYSKTIAFRMFQTYDLYKEYEEDIDIRFEKTLSNIIWDEMRYIPDYFEQVLTLYRDTYDENSEYHQKIFSHIANRFGYLIFALDKLVQLTEDKTDTSLHWFVIQAAEMELISTKIEIDVDKVNSLRSDKKLIDFLTLVFVSICAKNDDAYLENLINVVNTLFEWYPVNSEACESALVDMIKSFTVKEVDKETANRFIEFFEELPRFYSELSYEKIIHLKELISHTLAKYKPQDNKVFEQEGVKNKLILLNYLIDMEDLYYESGKKDNNG